jgi:hypothetical protein
MIPVVENFFPVSVDGFFSDPQKIVKYASTIPKEPCPEGDWPGKRSEPLWKFNQNMNTAILSKIFSCYGYGENENDITWGSSRIYFQEIQRFSNRKNDIKNKGWIHTDFEEYYRDELAGLIYLNPNIDPDSGTSLFNMKDNNSSSGGSETEEYYYKVMKDAKTMKNLLFKTNGKVADQKIYTEQYKKHEKFFIEKTRFQNIFNRMIVYDTNEFHRANNFYHKREELSRLTLVFFVGGVNIKGYPLKKVKDSRYEERINETIGKKARENVG